MNRPTWDQTFMAMAETLKHRSKDPATQYGAIIIGPDHELRSMGYNCLPRGVNDTDETRKEKPLKYHWFEHAERNAIYNAARIGVSLKGCTLYVRAMPCSECARGIIQVGITCVVIQTLDVDQKWWGSCLQSGVMLDEAQVMIRLPDIAVNQCSTIISALRQSIAEQV